MKANRFTRVLAATAVAALTVTGLAAVGTAPAGAIAGYELTGQYWTSGKALHFQLGLTTPSSVATNNAIFSTYLQWTNLSTTTATVNNYDVASCDLTITPINSINTIV